ncbi:hypothetical protein ABIE49_002613 [Bradyrhizobium sp. OAE829]
MKFSPDRPYSDPDNSARKLLEIANATGPVDGKIYIEKINAPMLYKEGASPAEYGAGLHWPRRSCFLTMTFSAPSMP